MPSVIESAGAGGEELAATVQQIALSSSDAELVDQLIPALKDGRQPDGASQLVQALSRHAESREAEMERVCSSNHGQFVDSVNALLRVRDGTSELAAEILSLTHSVQASTERLAQQKKALVDSRAVRQNIDDATQALKDCLEVLRLANQVHDLLGRKSHYAAALRALDELQHVHLRQVQVRRYKIAEMIERSVPATQKLIADAVMADLSTWLYRIRETSQFLGEVAFYHTEQRRARHKERADKDDWSLLGGFKLNSPIELVADESEEFDVLDNAEIQIDFTPLYECMHIHAALGQRERFRAEYAATRKRQKELLLPPSINLSDEEGSDLSSLLEDMAGFAIIERTTMKKTGGLRSIVDVDELWNSMCHSAITLIASALHSVDNAEMLLKIKGVIALFIQTMESWGYPVTTLDAFVMNLFDKYAELLKKRFSEDFQEIVSTDDYMPMTIADLDEYDKVVNVCWYTPDKDRESLSFPCVLPFSQMYPLCCIDIRNFLNQFYFFSDDHFQQPTIIDETLKNALDELLCEKVCQALVEGLNSQYPGQIVQILTNLEHFENACIELQKLLVEARSSNSAGGPIVLAATEQFRAAKKTAEKRMFELVNSKIDDLIETADYDWETPITTSEPSLYMQELTRYLSNIMNTVLLGLPPSIKELIYFETLSHTSAAILALPLAPTVRRLSPAAVSQLATDATHLAAFVSSIGTITPHSTVETSQRQHGTGMDSSILQAQIEGLVQTAALLSQGSEEEFFDAAARSRKYGAVDRVNGAVLLEKAHEGREIGKVAAEGEEAGLQTLQQQQQQQGAGIGGGREGGSRVGVGGMAEGKGLTGRERLGNIGKRFGMTRDGNASR